MNPESRFDRFNGHWFDASFLEEEIEGDPVWENPAGVRTRDIDWPAFLSGVPLPQDLQTGIALGLEQIDPPLMVVLAPLLKSVFDAVRRTQDAPGFKEIAEQLALLRSAAERLAAVAQGGKPRSRPSAEPAWWRYDADDVYRKHIEIGLRVQDGRSPFLHPLLQDHLLLAMLPEAYSLVSPDDPEIEEKQRFGRQSLTNFFKHLHILVPTIARAETMTKELVRDARKARAGAPGDVARNWALVRLMWIWRDVLREEPTIYLKKIDGRRELDPPEPQDCMAFVVAVRGRFDPVGPWYFAALERQLQELRPAIPEASLLR